METEQEMLLRHAKELKELRGKREKEYDLILAPITPDGRNVTKWDYKIGNRQSGNSAFITGTWAEDYAKYDIIVPRQLAEVICKMQNILPELLDCWKKCNGKKYKAIKLGVYNTINGPGQGHLGYIETIDVNGKEVHNEVNRCVVERIVGRCLNPGECVEM